MKRCKCGVRTDSNLECKACGKPICSQCAVRVLDGYIRLYHHTCEPNQERLSEYGEPILDEENDDGHIMGEGRYIKPSERYDRHRSLFNSSNWEDRIQAVVGIEELWFRNHDAEALGLYIKGMKDRSNRVKIAFLKNYDELFEHRKNREARLEFIGDISKNLIVQNLISTLAKLTNSKNEEVSILASKNLILTMDIIHPGFEEEFRRSYPE